MPANFCLVCKKICSKIRIYFLRTQALKGIQKFQGSTAQGFCTRCPWYISRHACIYCAWGDLCGIFQFADTAAAEQLLQTVSAVPAGGNSAAAARTQSIYPHPAGTPAACGIFAASPKALFSVALRYEQAIKNPCPLCKRTGIPFWKILLGGVDTIMICEFCEVIFLRSRQKFAGVLSHGKDF